MKKAIIESFRTAIEKTLPFLHQYAQHNKENCLVWNRVEGGEGNAWTGTQIERPCLYRVFALADSIIKANSEAFVSLFDASYPAFLVGIKGFATSRFGDHSRLVTAAAGYLYQSHETFECSAENIDSVANEFVVFVEEPSITLRFQAQLLNFSTAASSIGLSDGLTIRKITDAEATEYHGGSVFNYRSLRPQLSIHEYVVEGSFEGEKIFSQSQLQSKDKEALTSRIDAIVRSLRTFKHGYVGYDLIAVKPTQFCPIPLGYFGHSGLYVPFGSFHLAADEVDSFIQHNQRMFTVSEKQMQLACNRLADAETRTRPEERIVDAVIGMEALLLASLGKEERRGELGYRFSINYATLFGPPMERLNAFKIARHLYDLRSHVVHGSELEATIKIGEDRLDLFHAARKAVETLRQLINHFLQRDDQASYKDAQFWQKACFGLQ